MSATTNAQASYSFEVTSNGKDHHFSYKKAKLGIRTALPLLWPGLAISVFLSFFSIGRDFNVSSWLFTVILYTLLIVTGLVVLLNVFRRGGSFTIGEQGIVLNGLNHPYSSIHSFYVKSPKGGRSYTIIQQSGGYGVPGAMQGIGNGVSNLSNEAGEAFRQSLRNKNYKICMLFGEKEKVLAGGLTDKTAKVMLEKIDALI